MTERDVLLDSSLLTLTDTFFFVFRYVLQVLCYCLNPFCLTLVVSAGKGQIESQASHGKAYRLC